MSAVDRTPGFGFAIPSSVVVLLYASLFVEVPVVSSIVDDSHSATACWSQQVLPSRHERTVLPIRDDTQTQKRPTAFHRVAASEDMNSVTTAITLSYSTTEGTTYYGYE